MNYTQKEQNPDAFKTQYAPYNILIIITASIFFAEILIMFLFSIFPILSKPVEMALDAVFLILFITPSLYFFLFRPISNQFSDLKKTKELFNNKVKLIDLIHEITVATNEATDVNNTLLACITMVCKYTGWPVGHVYKLVNNSHGETVLKPTDLWRLENPERRATFRAMTNSTEFKLGEGLPGIVLKSKKPEWISDVTNLYY